MAGFVDDGAVFVQLTESLPEVLREGEWENEREAVLPLPRVFVVKALATPISEMLRAMGETQRASNSQTSALPTVEAPPLSLQSEDWAFESLPRQLSTSTSNPSPGSCRPQHGLRGGPHGAAALPDDHHVHEHHAARLFLSAMVSRPDGHRDCSR